MRLSCFGILRPRHTSAAAAPTFRPAVESLEGREVPALIRSTSLLRSALVSHPPASHPAVTVLPHISAPTMRETASRIVAANIAAYRRSGVIPTSVDRLRGY